MVRVDHVGPTAVPGMDAPDVIDVQVTVESLEIADELADALRAVGYLPLADGVDAVESDARSTVAEFDHTEDAALWRSRLHASADPGRPTNVHLRVAGWPNQQYALLFTDWLRANPGADISDAIVARGSGRMRRAGGPSFHQPAAGQDSRTAMRRSSFVARM